MKKIYLSLMIPLTISLSALEPDPCTDGKIAVSILTDEQELTPAQPLGQTTNAVLRDQNSIVVVSNHLLNNVNYFNHPNRNATLAYRLSPNVSLLIPTGLAAMYRNRENSPTTIDDNYLLGIYFSHLQQLQPSDLSNRQITSDALAQETKNDIEKLFIPRQEYQKKGIQIKPRRFILFFSGHGGPIIFRQISPTLQNYAEGTIAGFPLLQMGALLTTLAGKYLPNSPEQQLGKINIFALCIMSCEIGDAQIRIALKGSADFIANLYDFPFPIVIGSPLAAPSTLLIGGPDLKKFFSSIENACSLSPATQELLMQATDGIYETKNPFSANVPVVKFPGIPQFFPLNSPEVVEIGTILGRARREPLIIPDYFKQPIVKTVLVHAPEIPFNIIIKRMATMPNFFSAEPGPQTHAFTGDFDASPYTFRQVIQAFTFAMQYQWKAFTFKKLTARDDVFQQVRTFTDVAIVNRLEDTGPISQSPILSIIYTHDNKTWTYTKKIDSAIDTGNFALEVISRAQPATPETIAYFKQVIEAIVKMRPRTSLAKQATEHSFDFLNRVANERIQNLAKSLKILSGAPL